MFTACVDICANDVVPPKTDFSIYGNIFDW